MVEVIREKMKALDLSASTTAGLCEIDQSALNRYLNNIASMPSDKALQIYKTLETVEKITNDIKPIPLNVRDISGMRNLMRVVKDEGLRVDVRPYEPKPAPGMSQPGFVIQMNDGSFFLRRDLFGNVEEIRRTNNLMFATVMTASVAEQLIELLAQRGHRNLRAIANKFASQDMVSECLADVWKD